MAQEGQLPSEIPALPLIEVDDPKTESSLPKTSSEEIKTQREEARKDADSKHARLRDSLITGAGLAMVLILIGGYFYAVRCFPENEHITSLLDLLKAVIMLIIGYVFGTKTQR
jgi:hypothetical protein